MAAESFQVEVEKTNGEKTVFTANHRLYRFVQMPIGLKNAPGTFQPARDVILSLAKRQFTLM